MSIVTSIYSFAPGLVSILGLSVLQSANKNYGNEFIVITFWKQFCIFQLSMIDYQAGTPNSNISMRGVHGARFREDS